MNFGKPDVVNRYLRHNEVNDYLDYLNHRYGHFVTVSIIGKSFEKRHLKAIQIHLDKKRKGKLIREKCCILIEAGTHGREWITVATALYCIYQLTEKHIHNKDILDKFDFIIVPVVNADGYEYSLVKNPFWRKNRRPILNTKKIGIDCNRNYDFHWMKAPSKTRTNHGELPFSESETCAIRNLMLKLGSKLKFFLSLHSYAQTIMYPWGYTSELPPSWKDLHSLAECGCNAIEKATGRRYRCGSVSNIFHKTYSGSIVDYAYGAQKVPFSLVMELQSSKYGFHPPKNKIKSITGESWIGIKAMCKKVEQILMQK